jgi:hypothetical protein
MIIQFITIQYHHRRCGHATSDPTWTIRRGKIMMKLNPINLKSALAISVVYMGQAQ